MIAISIRGSTPVGRQYPSSGQAREKRLSIVVRERQAAMVTCDLQKNVFADLK